MKERYSKKPTEVKKEQGLLENVKEGILNLFNRSRRDNELLETDQTDPDNKQQFRSQALNRRA